MEYIVQYVKRLFAFSGIALYINLLGMVFTSLLESAVILLFIPMIAYSGIVDLNSGLLSNLDFLTPLLQLPTVWILVVILCFYIVIVGLQNAIHRSVTIRNATIQQSFSRQLRHETYCGLLQANWTFFLGKRRSDLVNLLTSELQRVIGGLNLFVQFVSSILFTLIQIALALWVSPELTLLVLICGVALALLSRGFLHKSKMLGRQTSELSKAYLGGITDQLNGIKDVKSNALEQSRLTWLQRLTEKMMQENLASVKLRMNSQLLYKLSSAVLIALFVFAAFRFFDTRGDQLLLVVLIFGRLWPRFLGIQSNLEQMSASVPAFKALHEIQQQYDSAAELPSLLQSAHSQNELLSMRTGMELQNVSFRYDPHSETPTLQDINLFLPVNRMTAIVGRSGAGKSTLVDLLLGLIRPDSGCILLDQEPLSIEQHLAIRRSISYVAQEPFLYNMSIRDNLMMVRPDATEEQLWEALAFSSSDDFVRNLPQAIDTIIGDRGIRLSGGERQRLVLARAMIRQPSILILDEATSALDTENERKIQEAIDRLKGSMTVIVVAHRLSTIRHADQVVVIENGQLVQKGTFADLASENGGVFAQLLKHQEEAVPC